MESSNTETHIIFATVVDTGKGKSDQTGRFTVTYMRGVKYLFILYSYDANKFFLGTSRTEQERTYYRQTQNVMTASRRGDSSQKIIDWITKHPMT